MPHPPRTIAVGLVAGALALAAPPAAAQGGAGCAAQPAPCADAGPFTATIGDFRTSTQGTTRMLTATVRFENRSGRPLRLGYVASSGVATDDEGNRYVVYGDNAVRGIGQVSARGVDASFELAPGAASDARFELVWRASSRDIVGTAFDLALAVREIEPLPANQFRLGREHALGFRALRSGAVAAPAAVASAAPAMAAPAATPAAAIPAAASAEPAARPRGLAAVLAAAREARRAVQEAASAASGAATSAGAVQDAAVPAGGGCGGAAHCHDAGPFTVQALQVSGSRTGNTGDHSLRLTLRVRNASPQPIILAYSARSSLATDELGNRYHWGRAGTHDGSVTGMGISTGRQADPQFALAPGEARNVSFTVRRYGTGRNALGTRFTYDVALEELELLAGGQVRTLRQHSVTIPGLAVGAP